MNLGKKSYPVTMALAVVWHVVIQRPAIGTTQLSGQRVPEKGKTRGIATEQP
jgi:hypothetical protein